MGQIKVFVQELGLNKGFWRTQIWIISLQSSLGPTILKVMQISIWCLKNMGKNLQNELWARPVPSKLSKGRPPTLFLGADTENGEKMVLFAFLPITPMPKFLYPDMPNES